MRVVGFRARLCVFATRLQCTAPERQATEELSFRQRIRQAPVNDKVLEYVRSTHATRSFDSRKNKINIFAVENRHSTLHELDFKFHASASTPASFPPPIGAEIAFVGRSNCGKSSLINSVLGKPGIARVSSKPGLTQTLNFFKSHTPKCGLMVVDMPGYGFAFAAEEKSREWKETMDTYLSQRKELKRVFLLIDSRALLKKLDFDMMDTLAATGHRFQVVLTKCDNFLEAELAKRLTLVKHTLMDKKYPTFVEPVLITSSRVGGGILAISKEIAKFSGCDAAKRVLAHQLREHELPKPIRWNRR